MAFDWAVEPEAVSVPEPLHWMPPAEALLDASELAGALLEGCVVVPLLLEPQAATASKALAATAADPTWLQRRVEQPTVTRPPLWRDGPLGPSVTVHAGKLRRRIRNAILNGR